MPELTKNFYAEGSYESIAREVAGDLFTTSLSIDISELLDPNVVLHATQVASVDGGATWSEVGSINKQGGVNLILPPGRFAEVMAQYDGKYGDDFAVYMQEMLSRHGVQQTVAMYERSAARVTYLDKRFAGWVPFHKDALLKTVVRIVGGTARIAVDSAVNAEVPFPAPHLHRSIAIEQVIRAYNNAQATLASADFTSTSGNTLVALGARVDSTNPSRTINQFTDLDYSNTFTTAYDFTSPGFGGQMKGRGGYCDNISGGANHNIQMNLSGASDYSNRLLVIELSGTANPSFDQYAAANAGYGSSGSSGATPAAGTDATLAIGALFQWNPGTPTITPTDSFTITNTYDGTWLATKDITAGATPNFGFSSSAGDLWQLSTTTWNKAAAGGVTTRFLSLLGAGT